jgi:hypothetical protein
MRWIDAVGVFGVVVVVDVAVDVVEESRVKLANNEEIGT